MRRVLTLVLLPLAAGLALSLLVAVALALRGGAGARPGARVTLDTAHPWGWLMTVEQSGWGWTRRARNLVAPQSYGVSGAGTGGLSVTLQLHAPKVETPPFPLPLPAGGTLGDLDPAVLQRLTAGPPPGTLVNWPVQTRFGWPMRCLAYWHEGVYGWGSFGWGTGARPRGVVSGVTLKAGTDPFDATVLPLEPLAGGLVVNTLAWGAAVLAGVRLLMSWRVWRRGRAGRCTSCGYDLRGLTAKVCPECGTLAHSEAAA